MSNILILGAGYVGTYLSKSRFLSDFNIHLKSKSELDYSDLSALRKYILNNDINLVINCSGFTGRPNVDECELRKEECWNYNVVLPLRVSETCKALNIQYIHISSGCIYSGYEKYYTEEDVPNFGLFNESSFYSKSKHAFETLNDYGCIIRIRMPISNDLNPRNFITKILNYDNVVNFVNSKTSLYSLSNFIYYLVKHNINVNTVGVLNFVNPEPHDTKYLMHEMKRFDLVNPNWKIVDIKNINITAPRSNCVLSISKLEKLFPNFHIDTEADVLHNSLATICNFKNL